MNLAIRGFVHSPLRRRRKVFEDRVSIDPEALDQLLPGLAEKHATAMAKHELHMIEIEFLDEPDMNQRFFRFGTDPSGMRLPMRLKLWP